MDRYKFTWKDEVRYAWGDNPIQAAAGIRPFLMLQQFATGLVSVEVVTDVPVKEAVQAVLSDTVGPHTKNFPTVKLVTAAFEAMGLDRFTSRDALKKRIENEARRYTRGEAGMIDLVKALHLHIEYEALLGLFEFRAEAGNVYQLGLSEAYNICKFLFRGEPLDLDVVRLKAKHPVRLTMDIYSCGVIIAHSDEIVSLDDSDPEYGNYKAETLDGRVSFPIEHHEFAEISK